MTSQIKSSAILLLSLGLIFSIPIVTKTWSAHGALPGLATCLLVTLAVFLGPLSFLVAGSIKVGFVAATSVQSDLEQVLLAIIGAALFLLWARLITRGTENGFPYVTVTCWGLMGAYFCVSIVFMHTQ